MLKEMKYNLEAMHAMGNGILSLCRILEETYGPKSGFVLVENDTGNILATKSSAAIVQDMKVSDLYEDEGVQLAREAIMNTAEYAGDGTTLTAILIKAMVEEGIQMIAAGYEPMLMRKGLKAAAAILCEKIYQAAVPVKNKEELIKITESAIGEKTLACIVTDALEKTGTEGAVMVREQRISDTYMECIDGLQINKGYISKEFAGNAGEVVLKNAYILITDSVISSFEEILPLLEQITQLGRPLCILADKVEGEALSLLLANKQKGIFDVVVIQPEGIGARKKDGLEDIAALTGGHFFTKEKGDILSKADIKQLGCAGEIRVTKEKTTILNGNADQERIEERIRSIKRKMSMLEIKEYDKEKYRERMGILHNKIAIIYAGALTKTQRKEEKRKIESSIRTARSTLEYGKVPGGGSLLLSMAKEIPFWCSTENSDMEKGSLLLSYALKAPMKALIKSTGISENIILDKVLSYGYPYGFNVFTESVENMEQAEIFDSARVIVTAVNQAVSAVYEWLGTSALMVSTAPDKEDIELMKEGVPIMR